MKPYLDVPFLPDEWFVDYLAGCSDDLDSVHFSLLLERTLDSRIILEPTDTRDKTIAGLRRLPSVKKYALLNSRFYTPEMLTDGHALRPLIRSLERFLQAGVINGIVYCDHYLLQAIADASPTIANQLEAVPSINTMLADFRAIESRIMFIEEAGFKPPGKLILDRALNRNLDALADLCLKLHCQHPGLHIEVLANEGCLANCPFKLSHDAYIALANIEGRDRSRELNSTLGCMRYLDAHPHRLLQSPFIRPEDIDLYLYHVDTIKLCGRTLGPEFLINAINAYRARRYDGNLLDLLDALVWLAESLYVDNNQLSFDFANMLSQCDNRCEPCGFCRELFECIAHRQPMIIKDLRATAD